MSNIVDSTAEQPAGQQARASLKFLKTHLREYGILFALIAIMLFFQIATGGILFPEFSNCGGQHGGTYLLLSVSVFPAFRLFGFPASEP